MLIDRLFPENREFVRRVRGNRSTPELRRTILPSTRLPQLGKNSTGKVMRRFCYAVVLIALGSYLFWSGQSAPEPEYDGELNAVRVGASLAILGVFTLVIAASSLINRAIGWIGDSFWRAPEGDQYS